MTQREKIMGKSYRVATTDLLGPIFTNFKDI
jgi:hypothetical protein